MKLENWSLTIAFTNKVARLNDFLSTPCQLTGNIYESIELPDGRYIVTDIIANIESGLATTRTGKSYELGTPIGNFKDYIEIKEAEDAFKLPKTLGGSLYNE